MTATIIPFPERSCFSCVYYGDSYCMAFDEPVESEIYSAVDCQEYIRG